MFLSVSTLALVLVFHLVIVALPGTDGRILRRRNTGGSCSYNIPDYCNGFFDDALCYFETGCITANKDAQTQCNMKLNLEKDKCEETITVMKMNAKRNLNQAVTQNVRTTVTDLGTETRFCIILPRTECQNQSTCFWDDTLTVAGEIRKGACISARFE